MERLPALTRIFASRIVSGSPLISRTASNAETSSTLAMLRRIGSLSTKTSTAPSILFSVVL